MLIKNIIFVIFLFLVLPGVVSAETITVIGTGGADIQRAIDSAKNGDTVIIPAGDYQVTKRVFQRGKSFNLIGEGTVNIYLKTGAGSQNGFYFEGSSVCSGTITQDAKQGDTSIILNDASQVHAGDLLKIWKHVLWCPLDYNDQLTGEMYKVESVSGNTVTLNEPLLRDYDLSDTVQISVSRPIEIHVSNIRFLDSGRTVENEGLSIRHCIDSSVKDCFFSDSGMSGVSFYSSFNVEASNNEIKDCLRPGSGYGVGIWSGTAYTLIENNKILNCRHCVTGNTDERISLIRGVTITGNYMTGGELAGANVVDAHNVALDYEVTNNEIYPGSSYYAFGDGTLYSIFSDNKIYGGYGAVANRGSTDNGVHIVKDNYVEGNNVFLYRGMWWAKGNSLTIENNKQVGGRYGVFFGDEEKEQVAYDNIIIRGNSFDNIQGQGIYIECNQNNENIEISENTFGELGKQAIYINGNSYSGGEARIIDNSYTGVSTLLQDVKDASEKGKINILIDELPKRETIKTLDSIIVTGCDGKDDQIQINDAIAQAAENGNTVSLPAKTYCISDSIILRSNVALVGDDGAVITIPDHVGWEAFKPLIAANECVNIKIKNIEFNGNDKNNQDVGERTANGKAWGNGFYNFIHCIDCDSVEVSGCLMHDSLGDGLRAKTSTDIKFYDNTAYRLGHDVFFGIDSQNIEAYNNRITTRTNSALRLWNTEHVRFFDNVIDAQLDSLGGNSGIQIEDSMGEMHDVEICGNTISKTWGPGIWLIAYDDGLSNNQAVSIHHNLFNQVAQSYNIGYTAGITINGQDGAQIKNNVLDGAYNGAVIVLSGGEGSIIQDNIITDTKEHAGIQQDGTGYGVANRAGSSFDVLNNCFFGNNNGNLFKCSSSGDDLDNPKTHITSSGWTWTGKTWTCDSVKPEDLEEMDYIFRPEPWEPETVDTDVSKFDNIFDILDLEFSDSGITEQKAEDIKIEVVNTAQGRVYGGIKIVGFKDLIIIDGVPYIPDNESILVKSAAFQNPSMSWASAGVSRVDKDIKTVIENGTATATLEVTMQCFTLSHNSKTGKTKRSYSNAYATFTDSCPAPDVLIRPTELRGVIIEYPLYTLAYVPDTGLTKMVYEYQGNTSTHYFMAGERQTDEAGALSTNYTRVNYWKGDIPHRGEAVYMASPFNPEELTVTAYTPYESFQVTDFDYIKKEYPDKFYSEWLFPSFGLFLILGFGAWYYLRKIFY